MNNIFINSNKNIYTEPSYAQKVSDIQKDLPLNKSLSENLKTFHSLFSDCVDIVYREFTIDALKRSATLIFISGLVDVITINENIIPSLMGIKETEINALISNNAIDLLKKYFLQICDVNIILTLGEAVDTLLNGNTVLLLDGDINALKMVTPGWKERSISEPTTERVIRGPKDCFTESIYTNTSLIRRKIKSSELKFEEYIVGKQTRTIINISYLQGIVDDKIVKEVRERIGRINVDSILESGYIEELIEDTSFTLFPQIQHSERPDRIAANLLEGKVAILVDGTPFILSIPTTITDFFSAPEDYYSRYPVATFVRLIRYFFLGIALLLPGFYVAIISYHKELIPTSLLISIVGAGHGVPFPVFVEAFGMELAFEALREAGIRLPTPIGQTAGFLGTLIIGEAAVSAGIISSMMVIIISITAIASFTIASYEMGATIRILRFCMLVLGAFLGLYGIMLGILLLLIHLSSLRSFGVNYLSPLAPLNLNGLKDVVLRFPWWAMGDRPDYSNINNRHRQKPSSKPSPPTKDN